MFAAVLFTIIAKTWKQPKYPQVDEQIKKMRHKRTHEYHSATKKNEIFPFGTTWTDLEGIMLCEISQIGKKITV